MCIKLHTGSFIIRYDILRNILFLFVLVLEFETCGILGMNFAYTIIAFILEKLIYF